MKVGLFIPCYVDQFYPQVGVATLNLLESLGLQVVYPLEQTCCGQPMTNAGFAGYSQGTGQLFERNFDGVDCIVSPSGSCTLHVRESRHHAATGVTDKPHPYPPVYELCEFLSDVVRVDHIQAHFPFRVGLHASCHGLRGLRLAHASELNEPDFNKPRNLLLKVRDIQLVELNRADECCGFGGTFAVSEEALSVKMGSDRIDDHLKHGAEVITGTDMSCLMHLEGLVKRNKLNVRIMHVAEILNTK